MERRVQTRGFGTRCLNYWRRNGQMKQLWLPLVSCLILGSLPLDDAHAQQRSMVRVALPGTIEPVILGHIGPAFTAATRYPPGPSRPPPIAPVKRVVSSELS